MIASSIIYFLRFWFEGYYDIFFDDGLFYNFLHFAKFGIVMCIVLFSFWPVKELGTPIYHRYKHEITHTYTHPQLCVWRKCSYSIVKTIT